MPRTRPIILLAERCGIARTAEPFTVGVPLPPGWSPDGRLTLTDGSDRSLPTQLRALAHWPDGSVRWCLVDGRIDLEPHQTRRLELSRDATAPPMDDPRLELGKAVELQASGLRLRLAEGATRFELQRADGPTIHVGLRARLDGEWAEARWSAGRCIEQGPLRTAIELVGSWPELPVPLQPTVRLHCYADIGRVRATWTLTHQGPALHAGGCWDLGDPESILLGGCELLLESGGDGAVRLEWVDEAGSEPPQRLEAQAIDLHQDSSGGEFWDCSNHVCGDGSIGPRFRGFKLQADETTSSGRRAQPWIQIDGVALAPRHFWQNAPKRLSASPGSIRLGLFPDGGRAHEIQGGERKAHETWIDLNLPADRLAGLQAPLVPWVDAAWTRRAGLRYLPESIEGESWADLVRGVIHGDHAFIQKREKVDEYGWRHFGELYADHEAVRVAGPPHLVSHYNNQYDPVLALLRQFANWGDPSWFQLADELTRHVRDIDIYHTARDRAEYNGGLFWHTDHYLDADRATHRSFARAHAAMKGVPVSGGGPALEHCYAQGLALHYFMTGSEASREAVLELAGWVRSNTAGPRTLLGALHATRGRMPLVKRALKGEKVRVWRYPLSRGTGNCLHTMLDAWQVSAERDWLSHAEALIRGCASPEDDLSLRDLGNAEACWSYTVFLEAVGRYLDVKRELAEEDAGFELARATLLHYAGWLAEHDDLYLNRKDSLEFPNETWPMQDLRKSKVLVYAALNGSPEQREAFRARARELFDGAIAQLRSFPEEKQRLTRPMVLLLQNYELPLCDRRGELSYDARPDAAPATEGMGRIGPEGLLPQIAGQIGSALRRTSPAAEIRWLRHRLRGARSK